VLSSLHNLEVWVDHKGYFVAVAVAVAEHCEWLVVHPRFETWGEDQLFDRT